MVSFTLPGATATIENGIAYNTGANYTIALQQVPIDGQETCLRDSFWSPNYGEQNPAKRLEVTQQNRSAVFATLIEIKSASSTPVVRASWRAALCDCEKIEIRLHEGKNERLVEVPTLT
jgi:hypothetical protein